MSGGSYDYAYSKIDELSGWASTLESMAAQCREWSASERASKKWDEGMKNEVPTTLEDRARIMVRAELLQRAATRLRRVSDDVNALKDIMHDVEWTASGDYGVDSLMTPLKDGEEL